jgi:hypothetical protein
MIFVQPPMIRRSTGFFVPSIQCPFCVPTRPSYATGWVGQVMNAFDTFAGRDKGEPLRQCAYYEVFENGTEGDIETSSARML